jgi:hypothetical protein
VLWVEADERLKARAARRRDFFAIGEADELHDRVAAAINSCTTASRPRSTFDRDTYGSLTPATSPLRAASVKQTWPFLARGT